MNKGFIVSIVEGNIVKVPCRAEMNGYYPEFDEDQEPDIIGESHLKPSYITFGLVFQDGEVMIGFDSWDGFQPVNNITFDMIPYICELLNACKDMPELRPKVKEDTRPSMDFFREILGG